MTFDTQAAKKRCEAPMPFGCQLCTVEIDGGGNAVHESDCLVAYLAAALEALEEARVAQPTAAREAALVEVLEKAVAWRDEKRTYTLHAGWFAIARRLLADTSPAAAALLAQGERQRVALNVLYGRVVGTELREYIRAALAPGEET